VLTFGGTAIKEARLKSLETFLDNVLDGTGTPIRAVEQAQVAQEAFPGLLGDLMKSVLSKMGM
jgi:hypothetical protein